MPITLRVNGRQHTVDVDPQTPLLYVLSDDLALRGPKFGCGLGQCGACTVIARGRAIRSCVTPVSPVEGADHRHARRTRHASKQPHPSQQAFIDDQAAQCGFCLNGVILTAKAFLDQNPKATDAEIQQAMSGVLCRCFTNVRMMNAIKQLPGEDGVTAMSARYNAAHAPRVPQRLRRARRLLQRVRPGAVRARAGAGRRRAAVVGRRAPARFLDRHRRRRQRHRAHGQVRARTGHADRADPADCRGAVGAASIA